MPKVTVGRDEFFRELEIQMTDDEFRDLCFEFGLELDDVSVEKDGNGVDQVKYKVEVAANRYDLLCFEGLSQALRVFLGKQPMPEYRLLPGDQTMRVEAGTSQIRPFVVCAVLRNLNLTESSYHSFIDLQEKLHQNICRKRTLVAIGTHDLDTLQGPFTYKALRPQEIRFRALNQPEEKSAEELMALYLNDPRMKQYVPIIQSSPVYPVIFDSNGVVLSMPPIINGEHSKITLKTRNVFIECTATDKHKAEIVLNTIIAAFSQYCESRYSVETVNVVYESHAETSPQFLQHSMDVEPRYVNSLIGIDISPASMQDLLKKMGVNSSLSGDLLKVQVPITRTDIIHACDIAEDIGIAYGYNKIAKILPKTLTVGKEQPLNLVSDLLRTEVGLSGYTEILTFVLHSFEFNYTLLRRPVDELAVEISNPKALEFQMPRTTLLPGILRTIATNTKQQLPIKVFEISDVVVRDDSTDVKAKNRRFLGAGYCGNTSGLEHIHGLFDTVMKQLDFKWKEDYSLVPSDNPTFFPKRQAEIIVKGQKVGIFGIIHPEVLSNFDIGFPVSALEVDIQILSSLSRV